MCEQTNTRSVSNTRLSVGCCLALAVMLTGPVWRKHHVLSLRRRKESIVFSGNALHAFKSKCVCECVHVLMFFWSLLSIISGRLAFVREFPLLSGKRAVKPRAYLKTRALWLTASQNERNPGFFSGLWQWKQRTAHRTPEWGQALADDAVTSWLHHVVLSDAADWSDHSALRPRSES